MSEKKVTGTIKMEDAKLIFKNFAGKGSEFNDEGTRNFGVLLDDETAEVLARDGWKVRYLKPREDAEDPEYQQPWLKVNVKYENRYGEKVKNPPTAVLITSRGKIQLKEDTIEQLDWTRIGNVDLIITPYNYDARPGRQAGVTAYLSKIYVTVIEDDLDRKYADVPFLEDFEESEE